MNQFTKHTLIPLMVVVFLLGACAPVPAATQDPAVAQQVIEQSVALTVAAEDAQQKDQQLIEQAVALTVAAQNVQAAQQDLSATAPPTPTAESAAAPGGENATTPTAESVTLPGGADLTPTVESVPLPGATTQAVPLGSNVPHIDSVSPQEGSTRGGEVVTITGRNFLSGQGGVTTFKFGAKPATNVQCNETRSQCTVRTPAGEAGIVLVQAENVMNDGTRIPSRHAETNAYDGFKYNEIRYGCSVHAVTPDNWTRYEGGDDFTIKWVIQNTGQSTWPAGLDFKFSGGVNLSGTGSLELPAIGPNDTYTVRLNATAPEKAGDYYMTWKVQGICDAYIGIIVE